MTATLKLTKDYGVHLFVTLAEGPYQIWDRGHNSDLKNKKMWGQKVKLAETLSASFSKWGL